MSQGIRISVLAMQQDFSDQTRAHERAKQLVAADVLIEMEFIGECAFQKIERLRRELRASVDTRIELAAANAKLRTANRRPKTAKPKKK